MLGKRGSRVELRGISTAKDQVEENESAKAPSKGQSTRQEETLPIWAR